MNASDRESIAFFADEGANFSELAASNDPQALGEWDPRGAQLVGLPVDALSKLSEEETQNNLKRC
jgi:hypothetical protein